MKERYALREVLYRVSDFEWVLSHLSRQLEHAYNLVSPSEFSRLYRQVRQFTMCSGARLRGLHTAIHHVVARGIPGDIVERGTARGGSAALMALTLKELGDDRAVWAFDTFEGIPPPTSEDPDFEIARHYTGDFLGTIEEVAALFQSLGVLPQVRLVKGLFQDTLPVADIDPIAVLHIDGDWYASVKTTLDALYDKVVEGGIVQIDDYGHWKGARRAVEEFFSNRSDPPAFRRLDHSGRQFVKPPQ